MRILANTADLTPNTGISVQTFQVTQELARRGHQLDLLYIQDGDFARDTPSSAIPSKRCRPWTSACAKCSGTHPGWCRPFGPGSAPTLT